MKTIKGLTNGSVIRVAGVLNKVEIVTLEAVATRDGETLAYHEALDRRFSRKTQYAWTYQEPGMITADYKGKAEELAAKRALIDAAPVVESGDVLIVDGVEYVAKVLGNYSDPVRLIRVSAEQDALEAVVEAANEFVKLYDALTVKPGSAPAHFNMVEALKLLATIRNASEPKA